jgi:hypothetical protein
MVIIRKYHDIYAETTFKMFDRGSFNGTGSVDEKRKNPDHGRKILYVQQIQDNIIIINSFIETWKFYQQQKYLVDF